METQKINFTTFGTFIFILLHLCNRGYSESTFPLKIDLTKLSARVRGFNEELARIKNCGELEIVPGDIRTESPWTAGIYIKQKSSNHFLVSGAILSPTVILSIFGGPYGTLPRGAKGKYSLFKPEDLIIGTGLKSANLSDIDEYSQIVEPKYILPYNRHSARNTHYHLYLIHLKSPLNISTPYVRSICIHLDPRSYIDILTPENIHNVPTTFNWDGFGSGFLDNGQLAKIDGSAANQKICDSVFKYYYRNFTESAHVFCAKYRFTSQGTGDKSACWNFGTPMTIYVEILKKWMVGGLIALIPHKRKGGKCKPSSWYFNANFVYGPETEWMIENIECSPNKFACPLGECIDLSKLCNGISDCDKGEDEEMIYCDLVNKCKNHSQNMTHMCGYNGECISPHQLCDGVTDCPDGSDEFLTKCNLDADSPVDAKEIRCNQIAISEGVTISCFDHSDNKIDCGEAYLGVKASLSCKPFYVSRLKFASVKMTCGENGLWEPFRAFACDPECGVINQNNFHPYLLGAKAVTSKLAFPWYSAIFRSSGPNSTDFKFICGGTLLETRVVLTAGHCIYAKEQNDVDLSQFRVVLAPVSSNYDDYMDLKTISRILSVSRFWVPPSFDPSQLISDVAILKLNETASYDVNIRPVCYLSESRKTIPQAGKIGKIAGFGIDETGSVSEILKYAELPVVSQDVCGDKGTDRANAFCAGTIGNRTTVCKGDSGGGMVFPLTHQSSKHVLKGVASHGKRKGSGQCNTDDYTVFMHVDSFADWMNLILEELEFEI